MLRSCHEEMILPTLDGAGRSRRSRVALVSPRLIAMFTGTLGLTLAGSTTPDQVTATVNIAVPAPGGGRVLTTDGTRVLWTEANPAPAVVTSP